MIIAAAILYASTRPRPTPIAMAVGSKGLWVMTDPTTNEPFFCRGAVCRRLTVDRGYPL